MINVVVSAFLLVRQRKLPKKMQRRTFLPIRQILSSEVPREWLGPAIRQPLVQRQP